MQLFLLRQVRLVPGAIQPHILGLPGSFPRGYSIQGVKHTVRFHLLPLLQTCGCIHSSISLNANLA